MVDFLARDSDRQASAVEESISNSRVPEPLMPSWMGKRQAPADPCPEPGRAGVYVSAGAWGWELIKKQDDGLWTSLKWLPIHFCGQVKKAEGIEETERSIAVPRPLSEIWGFRGMTLLTANSVHFHHFILFFKKILGPLYF